ncbi:GIY-YIG nuclease family protein [Labrys sp. KB_33_2]|uniref:GIY-YIG nuclease family protein n=1 Tax=Labrys sp. KB_33_2 TaxID=3237479 RepID=UPI003F8E2D6D
MTRSPRLPDPSLINDDTPLQLHIAAQLAYPDGTMSVSGLRKGIANRTLTAWKMAGRLYTSLGAIKAMSEAAALQQRLAEEKKIKARDRGRRSVYVMETERYVKVGIAFDVAKRLADLKGASPFEVRCVFALEVAAKDARDIERAVHVRLSHCRRQGEWFDCFPSEAIALVKRVAQEIPR